jgi:plastocyanin
MVGSLIVGDNGDALQDGLSEPQDVPTAAATTLKELNDAARTILDVEDGVVNVVQNAFRPAVTEISPGDEVKFTIEQGVHSITLYHPDNGGETRDLQLRAPEGVEAWDSLNIQAGETYTVTFDQPGVYDYFCRPHEDQGMVGTVIVGENDDPTQDGLSEPRNVPAAADARLRQLNDEARERLGNDDNANGNVVDIEMVTDQFQPEIRELSPGDTVRFTCQEGAHSTTLYHPDNGRDRRSPVGSASWDSGIMNPGETFEVTLDTEGVYDYYCGPHEAEGMVGTLIVGNNEDPNQAGLSVPSDARGDASTRLVELNDLARDRLRDDTGNGTNSRLDVTLKSSFYSPDIATLEPGGTVEFTCDEGIHSATLYHPDNGQELPLRAPEGVDAWDSGTLESGDSFQVTLDEPGVYDYFCRFHQSLSMVGSIVVGNNDDPNQAGLSAPNDVDVEQAANRLETLNQEAREVLNQNAIS